MHMYPFTYDVYKEEYKEPRYLKEVFLQVEGQIHVEGGANKGDYHLQDGILYKLDKICVLEAKILQLITKTRASKFVRHFGVENTITN